MDEIAADGTAREEMSKDSEGGPDRHPDSSLHVRAGRDCRDGVGWGLWMQCYSRGELEGLGGHLSGVWRKISILST